MPRPHGMRFGVASSPVERFWLVRQDVAWGTLRIHRLHSKRIVRMARGVCHWEAGNEARLLCERLGRKNEHRMEIRHLFACLGVELDEDDLTTLWNPWR